MFSNIIKIICVNRTNYLQTRRRETTLFKSTYQAHFINYDMDKVYLRKCKEDNTLFIDFRFENNNLKIKKNFHLIRQPNEKLELTINRIKNHLEKEVNKKHSKRKSKNVEATLSNLNLSDMIVEFSTKDSVIDSNEQLRNIAEKCLNEDVYLRVMDQKWKCVYNNPWVTNIVLPKVLVAGGFIYITKMQVHFTRRKFSKVKWYRTQEANSQERKDIWEFCGDGFLYPIKNEDEGYFLKIEMIPGNEKGEGPPFETITKTRVQPRCKVYPFDKRHEFTRDTLDKSKFRIVSYNLLAEIYSEGEYAKQDLFPYCPLEYLQFDYRKQLIFQEIIGYNADILCLQETDSKAFYSDLWPVFGDTFEGTLAQKGTSAEGVATFYRRSRFELLKSHAENIGVGVTKLPAFQSIWDKVKNNSKFVKRICERSTTLQLSLLKLKEVNQFIIVANTHLFFHPDADHIRLFQFGFCLKFIETFFKETLEKYGIDDERQLGVIFCGDFNSTPDCGIYKLATEGLVQSDCIDWKSNKEEAISNVSLINSISMGSACGTPEFTNYTPHFAGCIDYIFYQKDRFQVLQSVPFPSKEEVQANKAIPSIVFPSDHISLIADFDCMHKL